MAPHFASFDSLHEAAKVGLCDLQNVVLGHIAQAEAQADAELAAREYPRCTACRGPVTAEDWRVNRCPHCAEELDPFRDQ